MKNSELTIRAQEIRHKSFHLSDSLRIIYVFKGSVTLGFTAGRAEVREGEAEIININEPVEFAEGTPGNVSLIFEIDGQLARRKQPRIDKALYNCNTTLFYPCTAGRNHCEQLKAKLMLLYGIYTRTDDQKLIDQVIGEIEELIVSRFHDFKNMLVAAGVSESNMARLLRIYDMIYANAARKLNLKEIAESEFVSVQYLSREFNDKLHMNFKATVEYYKVIQAVRYLVSTDMSITTVSENSGFSAPRFFYKQFSSWLKCTPSEFRARIAAEEEKVIEFPPDDLLISRLIARIVKWPPFSGLHYTNTGNNDIIPVSMEGATMSQYTSQFKIQIAKEVLKAKTYSEISKKYGIKGSNLKKWADEYEKYGDLAFEENGPQKFQEQRIHELERQISELKEENEILKKATAFFSKRNL